jgi:hypothetical protein
MNAAVNTQGAAPSAHTMPRWASLLLAAGCIAIGLWASVVTLQFFEHGAAALENDPALQTLAKAAAYLFVFAEMSAFILAALIVGSEFQARRWSLYAYAAVVLIVEVFTISAIQIATVVGADMTQASVSESVIDLRKQIAAAEAQAATYTANAASLRANDQLKKAAQQTDKATAAQDKATALYAQLGTARDAKRPTLSAMLGETLAIGYAIVRGLLVPATGLIFFGVAGALMLRRADGLSVEDRILMALSRVEGAPAALPVAPELAAPVAPAPAPASFKPAETAAPKVSYSSKIKLAGAGLLAGAGTLTAPITHAAPTVPAQTKAPSVPAVAAANDVAETIHAGVAETVHAGHANEGGADASNPAPATPTAGPADVSKPLHADVSETLQQSTKKPRVKRAASAKLDTGIEGVAGARYMRVKAGVKAGKIRPSVRGIQAVEGGSQAVVGDYLQQLETDGVIVRAGRGFALVKKGGQA